MVHCCWLWLVWIIWQLVWTSTWQLGWKVRIALRCRMVLKCGTGVARIADTVRVSRTTMRIPPQTSAHEKFAVLEKTLAGMGDDEPILAGKRVLEKELEKTPKEAQWPEENSKAHRGQTKLDQLGIQTPRVRECKVGARELRECEKKL